jgi:hypothetical protein
MPLDTICKVCGKPYTLTLPDLAKGPTWWRRCPGCRAPPCGAISTPEPVSNLSTNTQKVEKSMRTSIGEIKIDWMPRQYRQHNFREGLRAAVYDERFGAWGYFSKFIVFSHGFEPEPEDSGVIYIPCVVVSGMTSSDEALQVHLQEVPEKDHLVVQQVWCFHEDDNTQRNYLAYEGLVEVLLDDLTTLAKQWETMHLIDGAPTDGMIRSLQDARSAIEAHRRDRAAMDVGIRHSREAMFDSDGHSVDVPF